jgi:hypothetical protein
MRAVQRRLLRSDERLLCEGGGSEKGEKQCGDSFHAPRIIDPQMSQMNADEEKTSANICDICG